MTTSNQPDIAVNEARRPDSRPVDVLVVGGGPVGLTMACELLRHGVRCRIIDKLAEPVIWSKAAAVQARTMEVFEDMGIVEKILERGRIVRGFSIYSGTKRVARFAIDVPGTSYPYIFGVEQRQTELVLTEHLARLGGTLERGVELVELSSPHDGPHDGPHNGDGSRDDDGDVAVVLRHADGRREELRVPWLVACDGAHSTVRKALELPFEGSSFEQRLMQADIRIRFPFEHPLDEAAAFVSPAGPVGALPLLDEGRYRLIVLAPPPEHGEPTLENFRAVVRQRGPQGKDALELDDPAWMIDFRFHGRLVPRYRVGRVFLAGDAAHIHSPVGGQGMNMGIQDAYNLAWKLALVIRGRARPALLDSYEPERRPVARGVVETTDRATRAAMRFMTLRSTIAQALRNQVVSLVFNTGLIADRAFKAMGGVLVDYGDSPVVGEYHSSLWNANLAGKRIAEKPNLGDWMGFHRGPGPGERIAELELDLPGESSPVTLQALLGGTRHTLLLFDGMAATERGYENISRIAAEVAGRLGDAVRIHIVVPAAEIPAALTWRDSVILDPDGALHEHFGSSSESLYLIRPDGHVGFRSQPAELDRLAAYLDTIFVPPA